jgi:hypothetical protein
MSYVFYAWRVGNLALVVNGWGRSEFLRESTLRPYADLMQSRVK